MPSPSPERVLFGSRWVYRCIEMIDIVVEARLGLHSCTIHAVHRKVQFWQGDRQFVDSIMDCRPALRNIQRCCKRTSRCPLPVQKTMLLNDVVHGCSVPFIMRPFIYCKFHHRCRQMPILLSPCGGWRHRNKKGVSSSRQMW